MYLVDSVSTFQPFSSFLCLHHEAIFSFKEDQGQTKTVNNLIIPLVN